MSGPHIHTPAHDAPRSRTACVYRIAELMKRFSAMQEERTGRWFLFDLEKGQRVEPAIYDSEELARAGARLQSAWAIYELFEPALGR